VGTRTYAKAICLGLVFLAAGCGRLCAQGRGGAPGPWSVETSAWMVANLFPDSADFYYLGAGYRLDEKDVLFLSATTWKYGAPLGIPYGADYGAKSEEYGGYVRAFGVGLGYQRFLWKGAFASVSATPFLQRFYDGGGTYLATGFQLYLQAQLGYQFDFFEGRLFLKPALSFNYWPVNTNFPASFRAKEEAWPNYFLFEPHLNIGWRF
jgi:hypothetical protein